MQTRTEIERHRQVKYRSTTSPRGRPTGPSSPLLLRPVRGFKTLIRRPTPPLKPGFAQVHARALRTGSGSGFRPNRASNSPSASCEDPSHDALKPFRRRTVAALTEATGAATVQDSTLSADTRRTHEATSRSRSRSTTTRLRQVCNRASGQSVHVRRTRNSFATIPALQPSSSL